MPLAIVSPNQASADLTPYTGSTVAENTLMFGFPATRVRVQNDRAAPCYVRFDSSTPSTAGIRTCAGEELLVTGIPISMVAVASTTTTTGTLVRVSAIGA